MSTTFPEPVLAVMRAIDDEITAKFAPQFSGHNTLPAGLQWDYDAAIAQARFDMKQALSRGQSLADSYQLACDNLRRYVAAKNQRYSKDHVLQRDGEHGQDRLKSDFHRYTNAYEVKTAMTTTIQTAKTELKLSGDQMVAIYDHVLPACALHDTDSPLGYINFKSAAGVLEVVATDGSRMVIFTDKSGIADLSLPEVSFMAPGTKLAAIAKSPMKQRKVIHTFIVDREAQTLAILRQGLSVFIPISSYLHLEYPRYSEIFPAGEYKHEVEITQQRYINGHHQTELDACLLHVDRIRRAEDGAVVRLSIDVTKVGRFEGATIRFGMSSAWFTYKQQDAANVELKSRLTNAPLDVCFNAGYLKQALDYRSGVMLHSNGPLKPAVFTYANEPRVKHLLMPVQTK